MNKGLKTFLIVLVILLVPVAGGIGYWYYSRKKSEADPSTPADENAGAGTAPTSTGNVTTTPSNSKKNNQFPLVKNASVKSDLVKECQTVINEQIKDCIPPIAPVYNGKNFNKLTVDGYYGPRTAAAVKFLFPETDGNKITEAMYDKLTGKRTKESYILF